MNGCLFCKIVAGEIPSNKVYEDETVLAFRDIEPQAPFHVLIIPKEHVLSSAMEVTSENSGIIAHIFEVAAQIARENGITNGFRLVNNCGKDGMQTVQHLHFHMLAGRLLGWPPG